MTYTNIEGFIKYLFWLMVSGVSVLGWLSCLRTCGECVLHGAQHMWQSRPVYLVTQK